MKTQNYVVLRQEWINSHHGGQVVKITLVGTADRLSYKTFVDPRMKNYNNWAHIANHPTRGYIVSGLKIKNQEKGIVNADSEPLIRAEVEDPSQIFKELHAAWRDQDNPPPPNQFGNLFD